MNNKKIPTCLGTAILVVIAITAGAFVWVYEKNQGSITTDMTIQMPVKKDQKTDAGKETVVNTPQQFSEMDPAEKARLAALTKDWQTYQDTEYGYEFKYPKGFKINKDKSELIPKINIASDGDCVLPFGAKCTITIQSLLPENITLIKHIEDDQSKHTTRFSNNDYNITYQLSDGVGAIIRTDTSHVYYVASLPYPEKILSIFQGVYFTFKEIEVVTKKFPEMDQVEKARLTALTKDWQTYRDTEYGYEFKYPKGFKIEKYTESGNKLEIHIVNRGDDASLNWEKISISTIDDDRWVKSYDYLIDVNVKKFSSSDNNIILIDSEMRDAIIYANKKMYLINTVKRDEILNIFQGVYFTFKAI